jgi:hypothetical protein
MIEETIFWQSAEAPPDMDVTVLLYGPDYSEVLVGFRDTDEEGMPCWRDSEGFYCDYAITHWAHMPDGPGREQQAEGA